MVIRYLLFAIVIIAIGIHFYWKISTTDKLKIIMMKKGEGILVGDYVVFNFTIKVQILEQMMLKVHI
jgi:hypothetical protein